MRSIALKRFPIGGILHFHLLNVVPHVVVENDLAPKFGIKSSHTVYQVCYDLSSEKTRTREINSLLTGAKATRCDNLYIITDFQSETITWDGKTIKVVPAHEWLLNE